MKIYSVASDHFFEHSVVIVETSIKTGGWRVWENFRAPHLPLLCAAPGMNLGRLCPRNWVIAT